MVVLVVEDNKKFGEILNIALERAGYEVYHVQNGKDAINFLKNNMVNIVISDLEIPDIDGLEIVKKAKNDFSCRTILMSGNFSPEIEKKAKEYRVDFFLHKPFFLSDLLKILERI
ncbi:MAG TPA: response regulator [Firmicutes bacterium]|nr:response regulator [Bacillota bacterium]